MLVHAVHIIAYTGEFLLSEDFLSKDIQPNKLLLGEILTALQGVVSQLTSSNSQVMSIETRSSIYHIRWFGIYRIVVVTDICSDIPENMLQRIGIRFMKEYGEKLSTLLYDKSIFEPFKTIIHEIITEELSSNTKINSVS